MAERKAQNKYYPPEWRPEMGSLNYYRKMKAFEKRPKVDREPRDPQFVIRFEMPFNIWCNGCNNHVGMGVRYNAQKISIGKYFTTPIYKFRMKCHLCDNHYEIRTDPQNNGYIILSGARRKEERWDSKDSGAIEFMDIRDKHKLENDAMYRLEHTSIDKAKASSLEPVLKQLEFVQQVWKDDYSANSSLRNTFRSEKKVIQNQKKQDDEFKTKYSLPSDITLATETQSDIDFSKKVDFRSTNPPSSSVSKAKKRSIFTTDSKNDKLKSANSVKLLDKLLRK